MLEVAVDLYRALLTSLLAGLYIYDYAVLLLNNSCMYQCVYVLQVFFCFHAALILCMQKYEVNSRDRERERERKRERERERER